MLNGSTLSMASKKERLTDEELLAQFEGIDDVAGPAKATSKPETADPQSEADLFQELGIPERQKSSSRPHTPRLASTSTAPAIKSSPKRAGASTPPDGSRTSEEKAHLRKSGESTRSFHTSFTPATEKEIELESENRKKTAPQSVQAQSSGGGWWGGLFATASAAVKQAEALAKEIQHNEEAQRWAEQVKGNVGALRGLGKIFANRRNSLQLTNPSQEENFDPEPSQPLPIFSTPSPLQFHPTNVYRFTSPMISLDTPLLTLSFIKPSPASWPRSKVVT